jgi:hypothetical protein
VKGLSDAVSGFLNPAMIAPRGAEPHRRTKAQREVIESNPLPLPKNSYRPVPQSKPLPRIEQALRATDLLLQGGGFSAIVLDLGSVAPEHALRVPIATWFRYRAAAEKNQASIILLTQHACAKSSAGLVVRLKSNHGLQKGTTVFCGMKYEAEVSRQRFTQNPSNVIQLRKPPQRANIAVWETRTSWAGLR